MALLITIGDRKLGSILQQNGYISDNDLQKSLERLGELGGRLSDVLVDTGVVSERKIARAIEDELGIPLVHLSAIPISSEVVVLLDPNVALEELAMPFGIDPDSEVLRVAFVDPLNNISVENIEDSTGYTVEKYQVLRVEMMWALATYYPILGLEVPQLQAGPDLQHDPLGKILIDKNWIKTSHLEEALEQQLVSGDPVGKILVTMGVLANTQLYQALAEQFGLEFINKPQEYKPSDDVTTFLLRGDALRLQCVPIGEVEGKIIIAVSDPKRQKDIEEMIGKSVQIVLASPADIDLAIEKFYPEKGRLGEALIKQGVISRDQLRDAIGIKQKTGGIKPIGEVLIELGFASTEDVEKALQRQRAGGGRLEDTLVQTGKVPPEHLAKSLAVQLHYEYYNPADRPPDPVVIGLIPEGQARRYIVFPVRMEGRSLVVAMKDPRNVFALDDLRVMTGREIIPAVSTEKDVLNLIERNYGNADMSQLNKDLMVQTKGRGMVEDDSTIDTLDDNAVVRVVDSLIREGTLADASDIHIEPTAGDTVVRFRIDGDLREHTKLPRSSNTSIMARLKIMGNLDISEKRVPQDGRVRFRKGAIDVDLRLSTLPTVYGEKAVMRILKRATSIPDMEQLGFSDYNFQRLVDTVEKPYGIFLITGPTGSGKSFSTFSILKRLARPDVNVTTIEDPVEYEIPHINQSQVNNQAGMTFARALRSFLRQDPDIIMVGEIRDTEVAQIALEAALTGHLVIATLHTNDAPGAVTRLEEMGIEGFNIAASLIGVMAQRLVKRICKNCKTEVAPDPEVMRRLGMTDDQLQGAVMYRGLGCEKCNGTGYKGRMGIHELMVVEDPVRRAIIAGKSSAEIKDVAVDKGGMLTLRTDGIDKVMQGLTTLEEVLGNTIE